MSQRYSYDISLDDLDSSHALAILSVPPGSSILDIGAADGSVARALRDRGCRVWGIEADPQAAEKARSVCEDVIVGDVERIDLREASGGRAFDVVLLLDVLEHLRDPRVVLERVHQVLAPNGRIIVSIPNVTHGAVRLSLLRGKFTYTETGLLDRTHLRFFDRAAVEGLLRAARFDILDRLRVERALTETEIPVDLARVPPVLLDALKDDPDSTTYQFVFVARPRALDVADAPLGPSASLNERLQRQASEIRRQYRELERYTKMLEQQLEAEARAAQEQQAVAAARELELQRVRAMEADLERARAQLTAMTEQLERRQAHAVELEEELTQRMSELFAGHESSRHFKADLSVKEAFVVELRQAVADQARRADEAQAELAQVRAYASSAGFRLVEGVSLRMRRYPRLYGGFQRVIRSLAGRSRG